ncbi:DUF1565 domain-containing protein, partial [Corallococcus exiguus]|uniref:DUF1565 domain-containing protein n=1 Tax=Corallococcus exiguus TaxID=83462 RepID=UPI001494D565
MRNLWKVGALSAVFGAVLSVGGCSDFDAAYENCQGEGRCGPQASGDGGPDAGDAGDGGDAGDAGYDCIPTAGPDYPDELGVDTDCDGVDGDPALAYFVDPAGEDTGDNRGTRDTPLKTLTRALQLVQQSDGGRRNVYLAVGTYAESAPLEVTVPVSIHGGYTHTGNNWLRPTQEPSVLQTGPYAVTVAGVTDGGVLLDRLHVMSTTAATPGTPSVALRAINSQEVRLRHSILEAGRGANGSEGGPGNRGGAGHQGLAGIDGLSTNDPIGGDGGSAACAAPFVGGPGGTGGTANIGGLGTNGRPTSDGGVGGAKGASAALSCEGGSDGGSCTCTGGEGGGGGKGPNGFPGTPGDGGVGMGEVLLEGSWQASAMHTGALGLTGSNGGG